MIEAGIIDPSGPHRPGKRRLRRGDPPFDRSNDDRDPRGEEGASC